MSRRPLFATIRTEGGLLPSDLLARVAAGDRDLPGLAPVDYHLAAGERLGEAITRSWNRLIGAWTALQAQLAKTVPEDPATGLTRDRLLLPLFAELGFGRLAPARGLAVDGTPYPISHEWDAVPIHLVGAHVNLDHRTAGVAGAAKGSPHSLVQDLLNRSDQHLWGIVANGERLRLLRDNSSLTRQAFVEFDLRGMLDGAVYADFVVLWLTCHQSRFEAERPEQCLLERWTQAAVEQGTRALEQLRSGVEKAIVALGAGFLAHPQNGRLRDSLRAGALDTQDYYRQLLRLVYRLIFLFVGEDRRVLLHPGASPIARERFERFYSTSRLRRIAERRRGSAHPDLWRALRVVTDALGQSGLPALGLPALGSYLWSQDAAADLDGCELANRDLLAAVFALGFTRDRREKVARAVDYRNLGAEELGSVYESLLELHPVVSLDAATFSLETAAGHERKVTGSYYTPTSLITELLNSSLNPLLDEAEKADDSQAALLALKVCDPACGSGHFLIAAANRIARRLAIVRSGDPEPGPDAMRTALRDVIGCCIYGIDANPMAVELCKVSLWLEALEPGRPLSFLDHRIACGNALLGTTPKLLEEGIPDDAFKALTGDDKAVVTALRKRNRQEREGQATLDLGPSIGDLSSRVAAEVRAIDAIGDETIDTVREKEERWRKLIRGAEAAHAKVVADAWCAAFVVPKRPGAPVVTQDVVNRLRSRPDSVGPELREAIDSAAIRYRFLHWHLAFPDVFRLEGVVKTNPQTGWQGGFDLICGNPPWERVKLSEREFFATRAPDIASARNRAERQRAIKVLQTDDPSLWHAFRGALRDAEAESHFIRSSGRSPLCGRGDVNTYAVFAESMRDGISGSGRVGCILPTGIATDDTTKFFFADLVDKKSIVSLYDFQSGPGLFADIGHARFKFCLLTMRAPSTPRDYAIDFAFFARSTVELGDPGKRFTLGPDDFALLNPNTRNCPVFRTARDADITKKIYRHAEVLIDESKGEVSNPWGIGFMRMLDMATDSHLFRRRDDLETDGWQLKGNMFVRGTERMLPLYEAKMVHHYDHRFGDYAMKDPKREDTALPDVPDEKLADPCYLPLARYWVESGEVDQRLSGRWSQDWLLGWRDICRSTDERTVIAAVIPRTASGDTFLLGLPTAGHIDCLVATLSSLALDYAARQKVGGTHLKYHVFKQLPVLPPDTFGAPCPWERGSTIADWIRVRVLELVYTSHDVATFARDLGYNGSPFRWDPARREALRTELDAAFFHLYDLDRDETDYILDTFPIVRRKDEAAHGEYRTKRLILERYDAMASAVTDEAMNA
jgi:hypothetical protein